MAMNKTQLEAAFITHIETAIAEVGPGKVIDYERANTHSNIALAIAARLAPMAE